MRTSCLCFRIQLKNAFLCLASAVRDLLIPLTLIMATTSFSSLWAMVSLLWEPKYSLVEQINSIKKSYLCVWGKDK